VEKITITFLSGLIFIMLLSMSGCADKNAGTPTGVPAPLDVDYQKWLNHEADQAVQIALGDILLVYHEDKSDLNNVLWVNPGGIARDPVFSGTTVPGSVAPRGLEPVVVANMNADQAKAELEKLYKEKNKEVTLQVKNLRKCILVVGELSKPGLYELSEGKTLEKVIEEAGGFSNLADQTLISVFRKEAGAVSIKRLNYKKDTDEAKAYQILPGDRITVLRKIIYSTN
jgi:protein involved in polysaccharide export with SLBB domain